jgi:esterase/lipase superfamily enzyme
MLRILAVLIVLVVGVIAFFVMHHPPMRLMPPPLMFHDDGTGLSGVAEALAPDSRIELFYASNRMPVGTADNRTYTVVPDRNLHLGTATLRIGDEGSTLDQLREWSTGTSGDRPFIHLERMREAATVGDGAEAGWLAEIEAALAASRSRDILIYVHGANTTVERAAGQAAQIRHFAGRQAVVVLFAWPTAENFLRYSRDIETAFGAAPHLAELVGLLARGTSAERIDVFTYSAGGTVGSDALAILGRDAPAVAARVGDVYHAAPDADFRGFVDDLADYAPLAGRVTTAVNLGDSALRLAAAVNRASRAGRPDLAELSPQAADRLLAASSAGLIDILQIRPENMPDLSATSHTFWYDDPWVSNDLLLTLLLHLGPAERRLEEGTSTSGATYWTFSPDYPQRMKAARDGFRERLGAAR